MSFCIWDGVEMNTRILPHFLPLTSCETLGESLNPASVSSPVKGRGCFCIQSPGHTLESPGVFLKLLIPRPHPRSTESDSLRGIQESVFSWHSSLWYWGTERDTIQHDLQGETRSNMIAKVPFQSPISWSHGLVAGARRIAICPGNVSDCKPRLFFHRKEGRKEGRKGGEKERSEGR